MKILITGASGLVGSHLVPELAGVGHKILTLSRSEAESDTEIEWDAETGFEKAELAKMEGVNAVIHLAGESVAGLNWSEEKKGRIRDSRVNGTRILIEGLKKLKKPPSIFIGASAVGYYGDRGDEKLTETSPAGEGFLAEVCQEWEAETDRAKDFGARTAKIRIGLVLTKEGGALGTMLTPFSYGVGGVVGSGKQYMSWISLDDLVRIFIFVLNNEDVEGIVNATSPNPVRNEEFTRVLGKVVRRPTFIPVPEFGVRMLLGEMGEQLLLEGARVFPEKLEETDFKFEYEKLESALKNAIK